MAATDYALVVGIDGYSKLDKVARAESDARAFESWPLHPDGGKVPPENVTSILSSNYPVLLVDIGLPRIKRGANGPHFFAFATEWTLQTREDLQTFGVEG